METLADLIGKPGFTIVCSLSGGSGNNAFQQSQIFREKLEIPSYPFEVNVDFMNE